MNLKRVIRFSASFVVWLLSATTVGIVAFIADEAFRWDLLPDWLERIAGVLLSAVVALAAHLITVGGAPKKLLFLLLYAAAGLCGFLFGRFAAKLAEESAGEGDGGAE